MQIDLTPALKAEAYARIMWARACRFDGIDPKSKFVVFSDDNPYAIEAGKAASIAIREALKVR